MAEANPDKLKAYKRKCAYGITSEQYDELLLRQDGRCAVCGQPERRLMRGKVTALSVDHNHVTGRVRGLLCSNCNMAVGFVGESIEISERLTKYLRAQA